MRRRLLRALYNVASFALVFLLCEGVARLLVEEPAPLFADPAFGARRFFEPHPVRGFALPPGRQARAGRIFQINSAGFRGPELPPKAERELTILAVGDSVTFGWAIAEEKHYPSRLERRLRESGVDSLAVVNAGVPSYSSRQVLLYLEEILEAGVVDPSLVLVSVLWNDFWYSAVPNWYPELLVHQRPAPWRMFLTRHSRLAQAAMLGEPSRRTAPEAVNPKALAYYVSNLREIMGLCSRAGIRVALVVAPFDADHVPEEGVQFFEWIFPLETLVEDGLRFDTAASELAAEEGVPVIEHSLSLRHLHQHDLFTDLVHPNARGSDVIARDVAEALLASGAVAASRP